MAHQLSVTESGRVEMMFNKQAGLPWHKLGTAVDGYQTSAQQNHFYCHPLKCTAITITNP